MKILDRSQIELKIARLAAEILEEHAEHGRIYLLGINNNGYCTAELLLAQIQQDLLHFKINLQLDLRRLRISPASPLEPAPVYDGDVGELAGKHVLIVDDVANTGRTAFFAAKPILDVVPASLELVVLIDRLHKQFPMSADYVGMTLSTSLKDDIRVYYDQDWRVEIF